MTLKRARTESIPKTMLLSVSGRKFEVGTTTLRKMQWFESLLAGRFPLPLDEVLFIDRDPDLSEWSGTPGWKSGNHPGLFLDQDGKAPTNRKVGIILVFQAGNDSFFPPARQMR